MVRPYLFFILFIFSISTVTGQINQQSISNAELSNDGQNESLFADTGAVIDPAPLAIFQLLDNKSLGDFSTGNPQIDGYIEESAVRHNIDPLLIFAQMNQESRFKQKAKSYKGASGLMQLMPATAARFGVRNIYDPQQNIEAGVKYMRWLLDKFDGDVRLALAGYNAGEGAVMKYDNQVPPYKETKKYVIRITSHYNRITNQSNESVMDIIIEQENETGLSS